MAAPVHELATHVLTRSSEEEVRHKQHKSSWRRPPDVLWKEFFQDPSQWWDNRSTKVGPTYPDFKHRVTKELLWIDGWHNPSWVHAELRSRGFLLPTCQIYHRNHEAAVFVTSLRSCTKNKDLHSGTQIHDDLLKRGLIEQCSDALVTMYAKCGELGRARALLDKHHSKDVITWTALIAAYARKGQSQNALDCFECMRREGLTPNAVTYTCILKACGIVGALDKGNEVHDKVAKQGLLQNNIVLGTALVDMYAKCGVLSMAQSILQKLSYRDVVSWNALITGYAHQGHGEEVLKCFESMKSEGICPDVVSYLCILEACAIIQDYEKGKQIHEEIVRQGLLHDNIALGTALVDMYAKCGALSKAQAVLEKLPSRDVVSWNVLIAGYARDGQGEQALTCFERMKHENVGPDAATYVGVLKACASLQNEEKGREIHDNVEKQGLLSNNTVLGNALVDMYAKCGALSKAQDELEKLPSRSVVSWSALIGGYAQDGQGEQALNCFERMHCEGIFPNIVTYISVLKACAAIGAADKGKQIHDEVAKRGLLQKDVVVANALVDMYMKCGVLSRAQCVLEKLPYRDVVSWTTLIAGYAQYGQAELALDCLQCMLHEGFPLDAMTLVSLLTACSHLGLVEEGHAFFVDTITILGLKPSLECYLCMVDFFARVGHLEEAVGLTEELPFSDCSAVWLALLSACWKSGDANVGRWAFEQAVQVEKNMEPAYIVLANIYAASGVQAKGGNIGRPSEKTDMVSV